MSNKIISALAVVGVVLGGFAVLTNGDTIVNNPVVERTVGAVAGPNNFVHQFFHAGFTSGSACSATSTTAAAGTLGSELGPDTSCVDVTPNGADLTLTLAASTSAWYPKAKGEVRTLFVRNATSTAGIDIIFAAGTGINLKRATTSGSLLIGDTDAENTARIYFKKQADGDLTALLNLYQD